MAADREHRGKRGPRPAGAAVARARNSSVPGRKRGAAAKVAPLRIALKVFPATKVAKDLTATCRLIPGYNPWDDCKGYQFDQTRAHAAIAFFNSRLTHVKGEKARTPFHLERWQQAIIGNLFGWVDDYGLRRYRTALVFVPRKNGKTILVAWLNSDAAP